MQPPRFWSHDGAAWPAMLLQPASWAVSRLTAHRVARPGWRAPVPVICCGNAGVGGAGKTTLVLDLAARLLAQGRRVHLLTRGHGGALRGPIRVDLRVHGAADVGDEALLLAHLAPTWMGANRAATARLAVADGAQLLLMDDGLQNPTLHRTLSLLVIDGAAGFGNGRVLPAGPLREPVRAAAARCRAAILIGADATGALDRLSSSLPVLRASLVAGAEAAALKGREVVAFAGIGRPEKFFTMLEQAGLRLARRLPFADHHPYTAAERARILGIAASLGLPAATTPKDHARIPEAEKGAFIAIGVGLAWQDEAALDALLADALP